MGNENFGLNKVQLTVVGIGTNVCKLWGNFIISEECSKSVDISFMSVDPLMNNEAMIRLPVVPAQRSDLLFVLADHEDEHSIKLAGKYAIEYKKKNPNGVAAYITPKEYMYSVWPDNIGNCFDNFIYVESVHQIYKPVEVVMSGCCPGFIGVDYMDIYDLLISSKQLVLMQESCNEVSGLPAMVVRFREKISDFQKATCGAERRCVLQISIAPSHCGALGHLEIAESVLSLVEESSSLRTSAIIPIGIFREQQETAVVLSGLVSVQ